MNRSSPIGSGNDPIILSDDESVSVADNDIDVHDGLYDEDDSSPYDDLCELPAWYQSHGAATRSSRARDGMHTTSDTNSQVSAPLPIQTRKKKSAFTSAPTPRNITRDQGAQTDLVSLRTEELHGK
jgi:hypothetical protein